MSAPATKRRSPDQDQPHRPRARRTTSGGRPPSARAVATTSSRTRSDLGVLRDGRRAAHGGQALRHRLLVEDAGVLPERQAWGFNSVHGRMPVVATGAADGEPQARQASAISGDGDTASIGIGPVHPRGASATSPCIYVVENNGRLRPHQGSVQRHRRPGRSKSEVRRRSTTFEGIDLCSDRRRASAAAFVARSFSADKQAARCPSCKAAI